MARKNVVKSFNMVVNGTLVSAPLTSSTVNVINMDEASIHLVWSGASGTGTVSVFARNGEKDSWYALDFGSTIQITGASGNHQIVFTMLPFTDIYFSTTGNAGGTLNARISLKQKGG